MISSVIWPDTFTSTARSKPRANLSRFRVTMEILSHRARLVATVGEPFSGSSVSSTVPAQDLYRLRIAGVTREKRIFSRCTDR